MGDDDEKKKPSKKRPKDEERDSVDLPRIHCESEQTAETLTMCLTCSTDQSDEKFTYHVSDTACEVHLEDGRVWRCEFYRNIDESSVSVITTNDTVKISAIKAVRELWPRPFKEVEIQHLKSDIYEKDKDNITVFFYVKNVIKDSLAVNFKARELTVAFKTSDVKFLASHDSCDENTQFVYRKRLRDAVVPELCYTRLTMSAVSVNMRKITSAKWDSLGEYPDSLSPIEKLCPSSNKLVTISKPPTVQDLGEPSHSKEDRQPLLVAISPISTATIISESKKKPTCTVPPLNMDADRPSIGLTGLDNLGNTCFMNSVIQTLVNTREFRDFFLESDFQHDINVENPLGFKGQLAITFAMLCRILWSGKHRSCEPSKLKMLVASRASQFTGFAQHDAQEFMAFLLDGLHEDLNRIYDRPYIETKDWEGEPDEVFADECWRRYKLRNDSAVVDLFQGQYKSKLVCPTCQHVSITFDPFLYLSVPLPKKYRYLPIYFFTKEPLQKPIRLNIILWADTTVENLKEQISKRTHVPITNLRIFEVYKSKVHRFLRKGVNLSLVTPKDLIFVFEVISEQLAGEPVVEISVMQRIMMPSRSSKCSSCDRYYPPGIEPQLKRCTKCYRSSYCDNSCQKNHWSIHKANCKYSPELVGLPFIISLPQSKATYQRICKMMESFARYSVDLFHPPVQNAESHHGSNATVTSARRSSQDFTDNLESPISIRSFDRALTSGDESASVVDYDQNSVDIAVNDNNITSETSGTFQPIVKAVIGQTRSDSCITRTDVLFYVHPVNQHGISLIGPSGQRLQDMGENPIDFVATTFVSMDWRNNERMKNYVLVQSKNLEIDENLSDSDCFDEQGYFTLDQCLRLFTEPETLTPDEAWYCPKCRQHREATKQMSLWRLPTFLIIQLKRFSFKGYLYKDKIDKLVDYPIRGLDLSPHYCGPLYDDRDQLSPPIYDLYAVINHYGNILGGHYTAMARLLDNGGLNKSEFEWRLFDDSHVTWEPESSAMSRSAYVLFYRRREVVCDLSSTSSLSSASNRQRQQQQQRQTAFSGHSSGSASDSFESGDESLETAGSQSPPTPAQ